MCVFGSASTGVQLRHLRGMLDSWMTFTRVAPLNMHLLITTSSVCVSQNIQTTSLLHSPSRTWPEISWQSAVTGITYAPASEFTLVAPAPTSFSSSEYSAFLAKWISIKAALY
ncbi:hypothetical protein EmuJ_000220100 [Echinococcus multilocularis]|uniref:Uncharacterized protein n=1 Tax=Echinococcus multilocularis TaxID=6211 RepID=A0A087W1D0_ECHMU|nr:hypothetical protein EmuJ_000220100 [Echinococcus multilocularis]